MNTDVIGNYLHNLSISKYMHGRNKIPIDLQQKKHVVILSFFCLFAWRNTQIWRKNIIPVKSEKNTFAATILLPISVCII